MRVLRGGSVHDEKQRTGERSLGGRHRKRYKRTRKVRTINFRLRRKERDDKYDLNQLRTELWMPN